MKKPTVIRQRQQRPDPLVDRAQLIVQVYINESKVPVDDSIMHLTTNIINELKRVRAMYRGRIP